MYMIMFSYSFCTHWEECVVGPSTNLECTQYSRPRNAGNYGFRPPNVNTRPRTTRCHCKIRHLVISERKSLAESSATRSWCRITEAELLTDDSRIAHIPQVVADRPPFVVDIYLDTAFSRGCFPQPGEHSRILGNETIICGYIILYSLKMEWIFTLTVTEVTLWGVSDVSDHFFWSGYRVNRTRFHSLSSEFSLYLS